MPHRRFPTVLLVVLSYIAVGVVAAVFAAALFTWSRIPQSAPRPLVDRSSEIEWIITASLEDECEAVHVELGRYDPVLEQAAGRRTGSNGRRRGWRYEGWLQLRGSDVKLPFEVHASDDAVLAEIDRLRTMIREAGGAIAFAQLAAEFGRSLPEEEAFYPVSYAQSFLVAHCNRPRHSRIPRTVSNTFGEFDPRHVFYHQPPDSPIPTAVFGWNPREGQWDMLGDESAVAIFDNVDVHQGCDVAEEDWYVQRLKLPGTKVVSY